MQSYISECHSVERFVKVTFVSEHVSDIDDTDGGGKNGNTDLVGLDNGPMTR